MTQQSLTPDSINIEARNRKHELSDALARDWFDNDPFITTWHNALSITFPLGEKSFIDSVRHFADDVTDPKLKSEIRSFCGQEGFHRREHEDYNQLLCSLRGYDLEMMEGRIRNRIEGSRAQLPPIARLAITVCLEHLTAIMAEYMLAKDCPIKGKAEPLMEELWMWHAAEEMEHKGVAFDVYTAVGGTAALRKKVMYRVTLLLMWRVLFHTVHMYKRDGRLWRWSSWSSAGRFLMGSKGLFRVIWPSYKEFFRDDFHPWQIDTTDLLTDWSTEQPAGA